MERNLKFLQYRQLMVGLFDSARYTKQDARTMQPVVLAYIGDAFYSLYIRLRLLNYEQNKVRILHDADAKMVSAVMQAYAVHALETEWTEEEMIILKRGRNTKSTVPKSASISEYRYSTGFEAVLGYLLLEENWERLEEITDKVFDVISRKLSESDEQFGGKK